MRKRILYLGLALIVIGVAIAFLSPGIALPSIFPSPVPHNLTVAPLSSRYVAVGLNQSGLTVLTFNSSSPIDFYMTNSTAFSLISASSSANYSPRSEALSLEGNGVYEVYENSSTGVFPYTNFANLSAPSYLENTTFLLPGAYYAFFYNTANRTANVTVDTLPLALSSIRSGESSIGIYVGVAIIVFFIGIGVSLYALFAKDRDREKQQAMDSDVAKEYERIEGQGRKGKAKGKKQA
ncbi:MAG: hypothetical protein M1286_02855 [Candidatus Marsarchaeota archaeon]|nr:hypothetical protein [Candidatus Marsarchaeota archaeon]